MSTTPQAATEAGVELEQFQDSLAASDSNITNIRRSLQRLERRDWTLWISAVVVLLLLTAAVFALSFPTLFRREELLQRNQLDMAVRGLLGLVLLFSTFALYQQYVIKQLRRRLGEQITIMTSLQSQAETFEKLAVRDPLTGLFNRRFVVENLPAEIVRSLRHQQNFSILMMDLDDFKQINDRHGHAAGDLALQEFARVLRKAVRNSDLPARLGGDEFLVLLPDCNAAQASIPVRRMFSCDMEWEGGRVPIGFAAGWAQYQPGESAQDLMRRADQALYENKRARKQAAAATAAAAPEPAGS